MHLLFNSIQNKDKSCDKPQRQKTIKKITIADTTLINITRVLCCSITIINSSSDFAVRYMCSIFNEKYDLSYKDETHNTALLQNLRSVKFS